jgi:peptidoglycan/LPS O-acetylase OafA/YrhL
LRQHYPVLDGLRGTAAIAVLLYHFQGVTIALRYPDMVWIRHAHIAVDFFYCLSGYVIALAYQHRMSSMGLSRFLQVRIIRLHPMVIVGTMLGLFAYLFDPDIFSAAIPAPFQSVPGPDWKIAAAAFNGLLMLPSWPLPTRLESYFPLNGPAWSLMWEYIASLTYALVLWRLSRTTIALLAAIAAVGLFFASHAGGGLNIGWGWGQELSGLARVSFSFLAGMLLFLFRAQVRSPLGFVSLSVILMLLFLGAPPAIPIAPWLYEASIVVFIFPVIVAAGAGASCGPRMSRICDLLGRLSYPVYLMNFPVTMTLMSYYWAHDISPSEIFLIIAILSTATLITAYGILVLWDEPVRRWLNARLRKTASPTPRTT